MLNWLAGLDVAMWKCLHLAWRSGWMDALAPYLRNQYFWAPVYLFLLVALPRNYGTRGWVWLAGFVLCFALGDSISGGLIKHLVERVRPCNDPRYMDSVQLLVSRSSGWSFPSSHATNHFALGTFCAMTFHHRLKWLWPLPMLWAGVVGYAQIYVGVHWPLDIAAGAVLGGFIGCCVALLFNRKWKLTSRAEQTLTEVYTG